MGLGRVLEAATVALATATVGTCRVIFETTLEYAKVREQYGRAIGSFQALKHRLADMYLSVERATALCYFAALTIAEEDPRRAEAAALAKAAAGECQRLVVGEGLQLHGGIGYTWEHDLHFLLKRAKAGDAMFGNALSHRAALAAHAGSRPRPTRRGGRVKLTFDSTESRPSGTEFLEWLAENRPTDEEMAAEPAVSSAHLPGWARALDPPDVRRRLAGAGLAARAGRPRRRTDRDASSTPRS